MLKVLWGKAFRAPTFSETSLGNNPFLAGNPNIEAEQSESFDLLWVHQHEGIFSSVGLFETRFKNAVVLSNTSPAVYENQQSDSIRGFELETNYQTDFNIDLSLNWTHIISRPDSAFREAERYGSFVVSKNYQAHSHTLSAKYQSQREMLNASSQRQAIDSELVFDWSSYYQFESATELGVHLSNITDKKTVAPTQGTVTNYPIAGYDRAIRISLSQNF